MVGKVKFEPVITSSDIEDVYLTGVMSVATIMKVSCASRVKYQNAIKRHRVIADRKFDNSTKEDLFKKAYNFMGGGKC